VYIFYIRIQIYSYLYLDLVWNKDTRSKKEYIIYKVFDLNINIYISISIYLYLSIYLSISLSLSLYLSISLSLYLSIYLSWNRKTDRSIDGSVDRCRDTSSLPHVFYSVNLASIWLQARFFWLLRAGSKSTRGFTSTMHSFLGVWNRSETMWQRQFMPTRPTNERPVRTSNPRRQRGATLQENWPFEKVCPGNQRASTR
jgi:hypothetical protein